MEGRRLIARWEEEKMPETSIAPPPVSSARPGKPVSEALLNEKVCFLLLSRLYIFLLDLRSWRRKLVLDDC